jgi:beta-glucosidase/6-phospho-beta-glucosidase/beta-galactosidase
MLKLIGKEKYDFFWDKFYVGSIVPFRVPSLRPSANRPSLPQTYFYSESDAKWFKSIGLNLQRLAINYRHLSDDLDPYVIKEEGFKYIDRVVKINGDQGIFTILDLHAAPGGQNL